VRNVEGDPGAWHNKWPILIDDESIRTVAVAWIFKEDGIWSLKPRLCGTKSLFWNAQFFLRLSLPFGIFFGMRLTKNHLFQCGVGWKLNGRLAILFRFQTDESAARGVQGPNYGQSTGYDFGTH
jgi:hypothetical protein